MKGDNKELLRLLENDGGDLYALLVRLTLREDVAEDLMQELFLKLNKSEAQEKVKNLGAYAKRVAINLVFDWWRHQKQSMVRLSKVEEQVGGGDCPLGELVKKEEMQEVLRGISQLNGIYREIFVMRYIEQESYEQIGAKLDKDSHHIRALCSKAMSELRRRLNERVARSCGREVHDARI